MKFTTLVQNIFYTDANVGLQLFVDCLGFSFGYNQLHDAGHPFCVLEKDGLKLHLIQSEEYALKDRPELRIETNDIEAVFNAIQTTHPALLHPNLNRIKLQPWKAKEFALLDASNVCVIIQQWQ